MGRCRPFWYPSAPLVPCHRKGLCQASWPAFSCRSFGPPFFKPLENGLTYPVAISRAQRQEHIARTQTLHQEVGGIGQGRDVADVGMVHPPLNIGRADTGVGLFARPKNIDEYHM